MFLIFSGMSGLTTGYVTRSILHENGRSPRVLHVLWKYDGNKIKGRLERCSKETQKLCYSGNPTCRRRKWREHCSKDGEQAPILGSCSRMLPAVFPELRSSDVMQSRKTKGIGLQISSPGNLHALNSAQAGIFGVLICIAMVSYQKEHWVPTTLK